MLTLHIIMTVDEISDMALVANLGPPKDVFLGHEIRQEEREMRQHKTKRIWRFMAAVAFTAGLALGPGMALAAALSTSIKAITVNITVNIMARNILSATMVPPSC